MKHMMRWVLLVGLIFVFTGCDLFEGDRGTSTGTLTGTVTNGLTDTVLSDATVAVSPEPADWEDATTDADGVYSVNVPVGNYDVTIGGTNFNSETTTVSILAGDTATLDAALDPTSPVVVSAGDDQEAAHAATATLDVAVTHLDGKTSTPTYEWTQTKGPEVTLTDATTASQSITVPTLAQFKDDFFVHKPGESGAADMERTRVVGISPLSAEEAVVLEFQVTATVNGKTYTDLVQVHVPHLPFVAVTTGLPNVPLGLPVLVTGADLLATDYAWTITATPTSGTSAATLTDATTHAPYFTPDVAGTYTLTNAGAGADTITVHAGNWSKGLLDGLATDGRPAMNSNCSLCHNATESGAGSDKGIVYDKFLEWRETGHSEIFTNNLNTSDHYGEGCFMCHTVGYNLSASNNGFDDQTDFQAFLDSTLLHDIGDDVYDTMVADYPELAAQTNIQCENCHGPNSDLHANLNLGDVGLRTSLSADVCASCHGEPLRHARFQQWEESKHGSYSWVNGHASSTTSTTCSRCHTANGFVAWGDVDFESGVAITVDWAVGEAHPQTCAACHDPHAIGTTTGKASNANVRVEGDTALLDAGFTAYGVGRGAVCMTCHNNRRGLYNDVTKAWSETNTTGTKMDREDPHHGTQGDVLMGQNAFFTTVGQRAAHSFIKDTCVTCHMELTDPPAALSYQLGGTNHTFEASTKICAECHGAFDGGTLQSSVVSMLDNLALAIAGKIEARLDEMVVGPQTVTVAGDDAAGVALGTPLASDGTAAAGQFTVVVDPLTLTINVTVGGTTAYEVDLTGGIANDVPLNFVDSNIGSDAVKGMWNYLLFSEDGSKGVHNPGWIIETIEATIVKMQ